MKFKFFLLFTLLFSTIVLAQQFKANTVENQIVKPVLNTVFSNYELVSLDVNSVQNALKSRSVHQNLDLQLGSKRLDLDLFEYDLLKSDYFLQLGTDQGVVKIPKNGRIKTYRITTNASQGHMGSLTISDQFFYGFIEDNGVKYFFEPAYGFVQNAPKDLLVVYKESDVLVNAAVKCGFDELKNNSHIADDALGNENRSHCIAFDVALANDYTVFLVRGNGTDAWCTGVLANVQTNYDNEFTHSIELNISTIFVATSTGSDPWNGINNINAHLDTHVSWANGGGYGGASYGLATAWTRKYTSGAVGLAWVGTVCGNLRYNVCSDFGTGGGNLRNLQAHEMGHNFNYGHDASGSPYIMAPSVNGSNIWSAPSITAISSFANSRGCAGGCSSGGAAPVANFKANSTVICVPTNNKVQFTDLSSGGPTSWAWTFPGGTPSSSNQQNPLITYNTRGVYDVTLRVTNSFGSDVITFNQYIDVEIKAVSAFDYFIIDRDMTTTNNSMYGDTYLWKFGDGATSTEFEPQHTYANDGIYNVDLEVTNRCGTVKKTIKVTVVTQNEANFSADVVRGCASLKVKYKNLSSSNSNTFIWDFPGGTPSSSTLKDPPVIVYPRKGVFDVKLTAKNARFTSVKVENGYITVDTIPIASFTHAPPVGTLIDFTNTSIDATSYSWDFGDNKSSTEPNPSHSYAGPGLYTVILKAVNSCGTTSDTQKVEIAKALGSNFKVPNTLGCAPFTVQFENTSTNAISYEWSFPGGNPSTSNLLNPVVVYNTPGKYDVTLVAINGPDRETTTKTQFITVESMPIPSFTSNIVKTEVFFTNTSKFGNSYLWDFGDNTTSTEISPSHVYNVEGEFNVSLKITNSCGTQELIKQVVVYLIPKVDFSVNSFKVCAGDFVQFNDHSSKDVNDWLWQIEGGEPATSTIQYPKVLYKKSGIYTVKLTVKNSNGSSFIIKQNYITVVSPVLCPDRPNKKKKIISDPGFGLNDPASIRNQVKQMEIFPNPNFGTFEIQMEEPIDGNTDLIVTDLIGNELFHEKTTGKFLNSKKLDLSNLPQGTYFLRLNSEAYHLIKKFTITK